MTHTKWSTIKAERAREPGFARGYAQAKQAYLFAQQIRAIRLAKGLSQAALARRLRTTQSAVSRLEMGDMPPSLRTLTRISDALGVELVVRFRERRAARPARLPRATGSRGR